MCAGRLCAIGVAACLIALPAAVQPDSRSAVWRATKRLGYGSTALNAQAVEPNPVAWANAQVDVAYIASQRPPTIPADIALFNQPMGTPVKDYLAEREASETSKLLLRAL